MSQTTLFARFARLTSGGKYLPEVDGIRFFAITAVFLYHLAEHLTGKPNALYAQRPQNDWLGHLALNGWFGVELFFVLSGFILAQPFVAHYCQGGPPVGLRQYFLRRITRLEPPYLLIMAALFCYGVLTGTRLAESAPHLLAGVVYLHGLIYGANNPINIVAWSLEIEVQFYLLLPLFGFVFKLKNAAHRRGLLAAFGCAAMLFQLVWVPGSMRWSLSLLNFLQYFLAGLLLADVHANEAKEIRPSSLRWDVLAAFSGLCLFTSVQQRLYEVLFGAFLTWLLYYSLWRSQYLKRALTNRWIVTVGGMCYTIYLIHFPLILLFGKLTRKLAFTNYFSINLLLQAMLIYPLILAVSGLFFLTIEKSCMNKDWPHLLSDRLRVLVGRPVQFSTLSQRHP